MTTDLAIHETTGPATASVVRRRLVPLYLAITLQGLMLWVPVEKLFLSEIGFTPTSIGLMAAVYAGFVPLAEFPSGLLADRWSRRGVLVMAGAALALSSLVGGLSTGVASYLLCAALLGVFFAMQSGTMDSILYDTLVEELGDGADFTRYLGWMRAVEAAALAGSALLGGLLAELMGTRATYFLTVPLAVVSVVALMAFREPRLHRAEEDEPFRAQVRRTLRTVADREVVLPIVLLGAVTGVGMQLVFEFGPLWLVEITVPTFLFGPHWAVLTGMLGLGSVLAGRLDWSRAAVPGLVGLALVVAAGTTAVSTNFVTITLAQAAVILALVMIYTIATQRLHDAIPSRVRAGVSSAASTLNWLTFLPTALVFGWLVDTYGVAAGGWVITGLAALTAVMAGRRLSAAPRTNLTCQEVAEASSAYVDDELDGETSDAVERHVTWCPGCAAYLTQVRELLRQLASLR